MTLEPPAVISGSGPPSIGGSLSKLQGPSPPVCTTTTHHNNSYTLPVYGGPSLVPISTIQDPEQARRIEQTIDSVIRSGKRLDVWNQEHPGLNVGTPRVHRDTFTDLPDNILENPSPSGSPHASSSALCSAKYVAYNNDVDNNCYVKVEPIENNREPSVSVSTTEMTNQNYPIQVDMTPQISANIPQVIAVQSNGSVHYIKIELDNSNVPVSSNGTNETGDESSAVVTSGVNPGTSQVVSQVPADSTVACVPSPQRRGKPRNPYENGNAMDLPQLDEDIYIDTAELCRRIAYELKQHSIPQAVFAERVLCRSQGTLSDLLRNPKPWNKLKSGRETFRRMYSWLKQPLNLRLAFLDVAHCPSAVDEAQDLHEVISTEMDQSMDEPSSPDPDDNPVEETGEASVSSTWNHPTKRILDPPPKKARLVFTDIQKRTLQAIFKETQRPSKEMQQTIAEHLGLDLSTVQNFFMNARRRSRLGPQPDEPSPSQQIRPVTPPPSSPPPGKIGRPLKRMRSSEPRSNPHHNPHTPVNNTHTTVSSIGEAMVSYPPNAPPQPLLTLPSLGPLPPPRDVPTPPALGAVTFSNAMHLNNLNLIMGSPGSQQGLAPLGLSQADALTISADTFLSVANSLAPLQPVRIHNNEHRDANSN